jgi:hypothetical protein
MPDDPHFPRFARMTAELGIKSRYRKKYPSRPIPPPERGDEFFFNFGEMVSVPERSLFLTIAAHSEEAEGNLDKARDLYEDACRQNVYGHNEQRDLQRFLGKHNLPQRRYKSLLPPNLGQPRRFGLRCEPHEEADLLRQAIDHFEAKGQLLMARNAMLDLYTFDPCDVDLYRRLRTMEKHPNFQVEFREDMKRRGQAIRPASGLRVDV